MDAAVVNALYDLVHEAKEAKPLVSELLGARLGCRGLPGRSGDEIVVVLKSFLWLWDGLMVFNGLWPKEQ